jgi:glutamate-5-semialdehyde dehydrogenase
MTSSSSKEHTMGIEEEVRETATRAKDAAARLGHVQTATKNRALTKIAEGLLEKADWLLQENALDLEEARRRELSLSLIDRLTLNRERIAHMADAVREVIALPDPVGEVTAMWTRPNGLKVGRVRIPLGVIGIIYESRPNVTVEASALCLKSGNAVLLRGGSEAYHSNVALATVMQEALRDEDMPAGVISMISTTDRQAVSTMLTLDDSIDLIIPRGGEDLIRAVSEQSRIPVIKHYKGVCHIFVDAGADLAMAQAIVSNAKVQRPGVCNALETLLVHKDVAEEFLPSIVSALQEEGVEIRGCPVCRQILPELKEARNEDWDEEYLDLILSVKVVSDLDEAIDHISRHGSSHTDAIVTSDYSRAQRFLQEVNSSVVLVNASTRFNDGNQLGLGAEIGISTTKLHAFGPMGLKELTTTKFIVYGQGHVRM